MPFSRRELAIDRRELALFPREREAQRFFLEAVSLSTNAIQPLLPTAFFECHAEVEAVAADNR